MSTTKDQDKKSESKNEKYDKYLTDIKELPPTPKDDEPDKNAKAKRQDEQKKPIENEIARQQPESDETKKKDLKTMKKPRTETVKTLDAEESVEEKQPSTSIFTFKDIILGVINLISIGLIIFLLFKLPLKATEFQTERIEQIRNQVSPESEFGNINEDSDKVAKLDALFLDESGVVRFVSDVESLKPEFPSISKVTFASPKAVKDEMGLMGIPVTIELRGGWESFKPALEKIQGMPYLFRPISLNAGPSKDDPSVLVLDYGVFLYVNDKSSQSVAK